MWKRLSRLWKKADASDGSQREMRLSRAPLAAEGADEAREAAPIAEPDPMLLALEQFDAEHRECGAESVVGRVRELVAAAPTDARVLRRAAALSRELGDEGLAQGFEQAATSSSGEPLAELGHAFLGMDDAELALALGDGAIERARERMRRGRARRDPRAGESRGERSEPDPGDELGDAGLAAGRLVGALALSRLGEHAQVLERLQGALADGVATRVRWALAALALGDIGAWSQVAGQLGPAERWIDDVRARVEAFPSASEGFSSDPQRLLFALYGAILLDDASDGERLEPKRLTRWMDALATLVRELLPAGTRPTWVSARGEVLARWLGSFLPEEGAIPLSARLPKQPVLVMLADDADLATLVESRAWLEGELPTFQAIKDPGEVGSPMADVIGVFRADVALPLEGLEAERAVDRLPPKLLLGRLLDEARESRVEASELDGFLAWVRARAELLTLAHPPAADDRIPLDVAREF